MGTGHMSHRRAPAFLLHFPFENVQLSAMVRKFDVRGDIINLPQKKIMTPG